MELKGDVVVISKIKHKERRQCGCLAIVLMYWGVFFLFCEQKRALLITQNLGYNLEQPSAQYRKEIAYAKPHSGLCDSPNAQVHELLHFALFSYAEFRTLATDKLTLALPTQ